MIKTPILKAQKLCKQYDQGQCIPILHDISFEIYPGETVAISGPSGIGKSTLLYLLGTLESPSSGLLEIGGEVISHANVADLRNRLIGFVFQSYHLLEEYTVLENVLMPARIARKQVVSDPHYKQRAIMLLEKVGMIHRKDFLAKFLSGGEKQRVAIARALFNDPLLLLADEPTGNLDENTSHAVHQLLISCAKDFNKALIVATHDQELAALCDRRYLLKEGNLRSK